MTAEKLAREVLAVLDKQQEYFRTRDAKFLIQSKAMERKLRNDCNAEINRAELESLLANKQQSLEVAQ